MTKHLWLVIIPALLDVFYWIGPQLSSRSLILEMVRLFQQAEAMAEISQQLAEVAENTNLFTTLSVPMLGVPGLMAGFVMPQETPLLPLRIEVSNPLWWLFWFLTLSFVGILIGTVYYGLVARAVQADPLRPTTQPAVWHSFWHRLPLYWRRIVALALVIVAALLVIYLPLMVMATIVGLISTALATVVLFAGMMVMLWLIFYLSYSMHAILLGERTVFRALFDSVRFVKRQWLPALMLFVVIIASRNLLSWLWLTVDTGSWLTLISIAGYGFINTGLVAATFVFYRDRWGFDNREKPLETNA